MPVQTSNSFRIEILPGALSFSQSAWNANYKNLNIPGYAATTQAGYPELLERKILVQVGAGYSDVKASLYLLELDAPAIHKVAPAPSWILQNGILIPNYQLKGDAYSRNDLFPENYYYVYPAVHKIGDKYYVKIKVNPARYNAVTDSLIKAHRIVIDVGLDGDAWSTPSIGGAQTMSPSSLNSVLRIKYERAGMYILYYNDLVTSREDGPFINADVNQLSMYYDGREIPIEVSSVYGLFNSGDSIKFFA